MNLLYIANIRLPTEKAHGFQIMKMCHALSQAGVKVHVVLPHRKNPAYKNVDTFSHYHIPKIFDLQKVRSFDPRFFLFFPQGTYIKFQTFFFLVSLFFFLLNHRKRYPEHIFYTRDLLVLPLLQRFSKKVVWECHSLPRHKDWYQKYWKKCFQIFVLTTQMKKDLENYGLKNIEVLPDAVDVTLFDAIHDNKEMLRKELSLPQDKNIVGFIGRFQTLGKDKGLADLLSAAKILKEKNATRDLFFCGVGGSKEEVEKYQSLARSLGLQDSDVTLRESVAYENVPKYCKACDVLTMPFPNISHYAYYMSPLKMFEYMASQRPIIASDLPSVRDVLNKDNCLFCHPNDPKDLAEKIHLILQDSKLGETISEKAYHDVKSYSWQMRAKRVQSSLWGF